MIQLKDIHALVAALRGARASEDLQLLMEGLTRRLEFHCFALVRHVKHFTIRARNLALHSYPREWIDYYVLNNLESSDPVLRASIRSCVGFRFGDMPSLIQLSDREREVMTLCREQGGITDGLNIPSHIPGELSVSCTFVVLEGGSLPEKNLLAAQLAGAFACEAARRIMWPPLSDGRQPDPILTARQLECVLFVGKGKTDWEIAQLLGINEETVTAHINEARRRYGVGRRAELPLRAVYRGDLGFGDIFE